MALLGMDIGGTKVVLAVSDADGEPVAVRRFPTSLSGDWRADLEVLVLHLPLETFSYINKLLLEDKLRGIPSNCRLACVVLAARSVVLIILNTFLLARRRPGTLVTDGTMWGFIDVLRVRNSGILVVWSSGRGLCFG